jgi:hypothetical protein
MRFEKSVTMLVVDAFTDVLPLQILCDKSDFMDEAGTFTFNWG